MKYTKYLKRTCGGNVVITLAILISLVVVRHPLDKVDDPKRPGRSMACVSCHNAHSSDWKGLFRYKAEKPGDLCQHCHR